MLAKPLLRQILNNDALTRGLGDPEARLLIEWLVERAESLAELDRGEDIDSRVAQLCRRARAISRFVMLWCQSRERGAAVQLAAVERFSWPLPSGPADPCMLMESILDWESQQE
jgi:hypothetical protein